MSGLFCQESLSGPKYTNTDCSDEATYLSLSLFSGFVCCLMEAQLTKRLSVTQEAKIPKHLPKSGMIGCWTKTTRPDMFHKLFTSSVCKILF